jgi:hypothetical protein
VGSGREPHGKENPRKLYAVGRRTEPASLVRGSSRVERTAYAAASNRML